MSRQIGPIVAVILALLLIFGFTVPHFLDPDNLLDLFQQISVNAILAFGISLTILIGGIDLSVGAVLAVVGTTTVFILTQGREDVQSIGRLASAVFLGLAVAASFGVINGALAAKTRMPPFIITLGTMEVARGAALRFNENKPIHLPDRETAFLYLGNGRCFDFLPVPVLVMLIIFCFMSALLHRTRFGQHLYAIGGNREAARFTGIAIAPIEITVYLICALLAGVAGMINTSQLYSAEPGSGAGFELNAIAAAVVGGTSFTGGIGTMYGTLLGAIVIGLLDKGLNQYGVHFSIQHIIKGLVVLGAVYADVWRRRN